MRARKDNGKPTKKNPRPHNRLALELQKWEANLVVFKVCDRIRKDRPGCWMATIHDAVVCLERDVPFVLRTVEEESRRWASRWPRADWRRKPM